MFRSLTTRTTAVMKFNWIRDILHPILSFFLEILFHQPFLLFLYFSISYLLGNPLDHHSGIVYPCICLLFSYSVVPDPLWLQHIRVVCPPLSPGVCSNSRPLSQWCYLIISSSAALLLLTAVFLNIGVFPTESALCIRWPMYWDFSFSISP